MSMSEILIKNVEMPMHCAMCGFHGAMGDPMISQHFCKVTGVRILNPYKGHLDDCPLIPVPPHGRLIDADALEKEAQKRMLICGKNGNQFQKPYEIMRAIALAPTIIPAEDDK